METSVRASQALSAANDEPPAMLDRALELAALGFYVFPLEVGQKLPHIDGWQRRASRNAEQIRRWWTCPVMGVEQGYNVGISTTHYWNGNADRALVVVDIDDKAEKSGSAELEKRQQEGKDVPATLTARTPTGGRHLFYAIDIAVKQGANVLGAGLDIRSHHGYVVGAGSEIDGTPYRWEAPAQVIAECPQWIADKCGAPIERTTNQATPPPSVALDLPGNIARAEHWLLNEAPAAVDGDGGDSAAFLVAARVRDLGVTESRCLDLMLDQWNERCSPPWAPDELSEKIANAYRYAKKPAGSATPDYDFEAIEASEVGAAKAPKLEERIALLGQNGGTARLEGQREVEQLVAQLAVCELPYGRKMFHLRQLKAACPELDLNDLRRSLKEAGGQKRDEDRRPTHHEIAMSWIEAQGEPAPVGDEGVMWRYQEGAWHRMELASVEVEIAREYHRDLKTKPAFKAVAGHIFDILHRPDFFDGAPIGIATLDGFVTVKDGQIEVSPLAPSHRQRVILRARVEDGRPVQFLAFLERTLAGEGCADQISLVQEAMGAALLGTMARRQKMMMFLGVGSAGKSTLLNIIESMFPRGAVSAVSPFRWNQEYYVAQLAGKRLNVVGELEKGEQIPAAAVKQVSGGDMLSGRHPNNRPFEFRNSAAHIFNTNHYINTTDHSSAFYRRWLIVRFINAVREADQNAELDREIIATELGQIVRWALDGGLRVELRNRFTETATHLGAMSEWRRDSDSVAAFVYDEEANKLGAELWEERTRLYARYRQWCQEDGRRAVNKKNFFERLGSLGFQPAKRRGCRGFTGISCREFG